MSYFNNKAADGRQAYKDGLSINMNPYGYGTTKYWQWSSGWNQEAAMRPIKADGSVLTRYENKSRAQLERYTFVLERELKKRRTNRKVMLGSLLLNICLTAFLIGGLIP